MDIVERQYANAKGNAERLSASEIDVRLSTYGVNGVLRDEILERLSEIEHLRAAILKHRRDTWGDGPIKHPNDADLYAVVKEG